MKPLLTVYTATYNRVALLPRVYSSLCRQTCKDFLWLVIDDGSTDNTSELVQKWIEEEIISIKYVYKENGGVHTARSLACRICETELITWCDSDDWLKDNAVELWLNFWKENGGAQYAGIISVAENEKGERITDFFPSVKALSYQEYTYKYGCRKESHSLFNLMIIKTLQDYPVFSDERLVGEDFKWIQFPEDKPFLLMDKATRIYEQQADGYIKNVALNRFKNPKGFRAAYRQKILYSKYWNPWLKGHLGYIAFSLILKDKHFIKDSPEPFITATLFPFGLAVYWRFVMQRYKAEHAGSR